MKKIALLLIAITLVCGCGKDGEIPKELPKELQSLIVKAFPDIVSYAASSKITCIANLAATIKITKDGAVVFEQTGKQVEFTTPSLKETTTFQVTVGSGSTAKTQEITIPVAPIDPRLKLVFEGEWQLSSKWLKEPGATEYELLSFPPCIYDDVVIFRPDNTLFFSYGTELCNTNQKGGVGEYKYSIVENKVQIVWGSTFTIKDDKDVSTKELKLHFRSSHNGVNDAAESINIYTNVAKK